MKILSQDLITNATITNSDIIITAPGHPIANVQDPRLSHTAWIQPSGYVGDMYMESMYNQNSYADLRESGGAIIDFDLGAEYTFDTLTLAGNNFQNIDYTITWSKTAVVSPDGTKEYLVNGPEWASFIELSQIPVTARYIRIVIDNANPTTTWLSIGRISVGQSAIMPALGPVYDVDHISNANRSISSSRQLYGGPVAIYRRVNVSYPMIESQDELLSFFREVDLYTPFYVQFDDDCPLEEPVLYCTLSETSLPFNYNAGKFYTSRLSFEELF